MLKGSVARRGLGPAGLFGTITLGPEGPTGGITVLHYFVSEFLLAYTIASGEDHFDGLQPTEALKRAARDWWKRYTELTKNPNQSVKIRDPQNTSLLAVLHSHCCAEGSRVYTSEEGTRFRFELTEDGGVGSWDGYFLTLAGEIPCGETPRDPINWRGLADRVKDLRKKETR